MIVETKKTKDVVDITDRLNELLTRNNVKDGVMHLLLTHTTAGLTTADLDPGTDQDMIDAFDKIIPKMKYRHPHNPEHTPDHLLSSLIGTTLTLIVEDGHLVLGTWQRVVVVEFDGPRKREIVIQW